MTYSSIGIIALFVQLIINHEVFDRNAKNEHIPVVGPYRAFLNSVVFYYITDILWGVFDEHHMMTPLYVDTVVYFIAMAMSVFTWTRYVISYLNEKSRFGKVLHAMGQIFFVVQILSVVINFFSPIVFSFDQNGTYHAAPLRYINLALQIILFFMTSVHSLIAGQKATGRKKTRYRTISLCGLEMICFIMVQFIFPLLPLYSVSLLMGTCVLHSFVLEDEKNEYRNMLESSLKRENEQREALGSAKHLAYTDPLTGVKSKNAYLEVSELIDIDIANGSLTELGVIVFDLNDLKSVNDTLGHEEGDKFIRNACSLICRQFSHSPVYRIGGDEFVALLKGNDYNMSTDLLRAFDEQMEENLLTGNVVVSTGMDRFIPGQDTSLSDIFNRADKKMYERKSMLKDKARRMGKNAGQVKASRSERQATK